MVNIVLKWNKLTYACELDPTLGVLIFKSQVYSLTGVPPERQKLMAKGAWAGVLKDDADMTMMPLPDGLQVLLMGTADSIAAPQVKVEFVEDMPAEEQLKKGAVIPAGFTNLGNTCYMNATLQCFRAMDSLRSALEQIRPGSAGKRCCCASVSNIHTSADSALSVSLRETLRGLDQSVHPYMPIQFLNQLRMNYPQFAQRGSNGGFSQQDAEEFYNVIAQSIGAALGSVGGDIRSLIGIELDETLTCSESDQEPVTQRTERVNKLVCNIQVQLIANSCDYNFFCKGGIGSSTNTEHLYEGIKLGLEGSVEKFSEKLNRNALWAKQLRIKSLPQYLCVQFMRFFWKATPESRDHAGVKCKILRPVVSPEVLCPFITLYPNRRVDVSCI